MKLWNALKLKCNLWTPHWFLLSDACKILHDSLLHSLYKVFRCCAHTREPAFIDIVERRLLNQSCRGRGVLHSYFIRFLVDVFSSPVVCMLPGEPTTWETTVCINDKPCRALAAFCSIGGTSPLITFIFVIEAETHFRRALETLPLLGLGTLEVGRHLETNGDNRIFLASLEKCTRTFQAFGWIGNLMLRWHRVLALAAWLTCDRFVQCVSTSILGASWPLSVKLTRTNFKQDHTSITHYNAPIHEFDVTFLGQVTWWY